MSSKYLCHIMMTPYNTACLFIIKHFYYYLHLMWLKLLTKLMLTTCNVYNYIGVPERKRRVEIETQELNPSILNEEYANYPPNKKGITLLSHSKKARSEKLNFWLFGVLSVKSDLGYMILLMT